MERRKDSSGAHFARGLAGDRNRVLNVFQMLFVVVVGWALVIGMAWILTGCVTPAPVIRTPDIVEIEIPVPIPFPFDCECQCQPHKTLELKVEEELRPDFYYHHALPMEEP